MWARCWWTSRRTRWASSAWTSRCGFPFEFRFAPIIHRNTPLPASRSELFYTYHDNQTEVEIDVYQGESDDVRRNHRVGKFMVQGLSPVSAGNPIVVQLDLNLDGMLKVSARERATGLQKQVVIENALAHFEAEERDEARERLDQSVGGPGARTSGTTRTRTMRAEPMARRSHCRWRRVRARASVRRCRRGPCWRRRSVCWSRCRRRTEPEVERLMEKVRTALTDRQWDNV